MIININMGNGVMKLINRNTNEAIVLNTDSVEDFTINKEYIDANPYLHYNNKTEYSFSVDTTDTKELEKLLYTANKEQPYNVEFIKRREIEVQARKHKKKRINKKWLKKYGYKTIWIPTEKTIINNVHIDCNIEGNI